jgi:hypothetical protein
MPQMSWVWALATVSKGQLDNTIVPSAGVVPTRTQSALHRCRREAVPGLLWGQRLLGLGLRRRLLLPLHIADSRQCFLTVVGWPQPCRFRDL